MEKEHKLNAVGSCTCGVWGCRRWRDNFVKAGQEKRCKNCLRTLTVREEPDGSSSLWCLHCSTSNMPM